jgi:nicotinamidase-related amidase
MAQQETGDNVVAARNSKRIIKVPWHFYQHYPADFTAWSRAARGFKGWTSEVRELDLRKTALLLMHLPDAGLTPDSEWGPNSPRPDLLGTVEWVPRTMELCSHRLPPLVTAAREAGLQVVHVYGGIGDPKEPCAARSLAEIGSPPSADEDRITADSKVSERHTRDVFGTTFPRPPGSPEHVPGLPEALRPQGNDLVVAESWQLHRLMKNRGITHLIYTGWALNWCLWFSPCGMSDMQRKGYLCSAVRGGCVAIENRESADAESNLEYAYWKTTTMFGYIFDLHELTAALKRSHASR